MTDQPEPRPPSTARAAAMAGLLTIVIIGIAAIGDANFKQQPASTTADAQAALAAAPPADKPAQVSGGGVTLVSTSVDFPDDDAQYPAGPGAEAANANCLACHSAAMALTQPRMSADQWMATVQKMRDAYKAPVVDKDVPTIVQYLTTINGKLTTGPAPAPTTAQKGPAAAPSGAANG